MRLAVTILIVSLMAAALSGACGWIGLPEDWCRITALAGWSSGLLVLVGLWAEAAVREAPLGNAGSDGVI